ncbi:MAG TPA: (Fe-S)-binding protein [Chloroflexota bacterium]
MATNEPLSNAAAGAPTLIPLGEGFVGTPRFVDEDAPEYDNLLACIRCGLCLSVCPTYATDGLEVQSPRGRVGLIRGVMEGRLELTESFKEHMYHCLDCRACQTVCPSGVKIGEQVLKARAEIAKHGPEPFVERAIKAVVLRWLLARPERVELAAVPLRLYQRLGIQRLVRSLGLLRLLPQRLRLMEELLRPLPAQPLRQVLAEVTPAKGERRYRVGFFLGCVMNVVFADTSSATVRVLTENGCEVVTPKAQRCCGAPHAGEGDTDTLRDLARHNVDLFLQWDLDYIVADCAACSAQTKEYAHVLAHDPAYAEKARQFSAKVRDITELLAEIPLKQPLAEVRSTVTYHEACHLCHAQGVRKEPRQVLQRVPGVRLVEMKEADWCCGSAGPYNITHPERAERILQRKLENIQATGAEVVVTGNPGCLLQLEAGVRRYGLKADVKHVVEVLDEAYRRGAGERADAP